MMDTPRQDDWQSRLTMLKRTLEDHEFEVFLVEKLVEAKDIVLHHIIPQTGAKRISYGDSLTCLSSGLFEMLRRNSTIEFIDLFREPLVLEEWLELARRALLVDLFITGTNAVTETGILVNLDMVGNRVGGITFGPKAVVILVGRNKVVRDLDAAMQRVKNYAAPANAARLEKHTPCATLSYCVDCTSQERICCIWSLVERSFPRHRIKVILINEEVGL
jgi:hypothetical protein